MSIDHVSQLLTVGFSESQLHLAFLVLLWANLIFFPKQVISTLLSQSH
jgi:hypothetical protein